MKYVSYLRVSTKKQGGDGLGISAQRSIVEKQAEHHEIIMEFIEVESGTKGDRPVLAEALLLCRTTGATLLVAKIDRLYRNVYFTAKLMESNVNFVCCDMPFADKMTIQIFAVLAEWEAKRISERTKAALAEVKIHGSKSGLPVGTTYGSRKFSQVGVGAKYAKAKRNPVNRMAFAFIKELKAGKMSSEKIARKLNDAGYLTDREKPFTAVIVNYVYRLFESEVIERKINEGIRLKPVMIEEMSSHAAYNKRVEAYQKTLAD